MLLERSGDRVKAKAALSEVAALLDPVPIDFIRYRPQLLLLAGLANIWLQLPALMLAVSTLSVLIFSAFILYDLKRVVDGGETNYVSATLAVYLDVYNVFTSLLQLLMALGGAGDD